MTDLEDSALPMLFLGDLKSWELPELTALNTVPAHALIIPFPTADTARDAAAPSPWFQSLSGTWDFKLLPRPEAATAAALTGDGWAPITGARQLDDARLWRAPLHQCRDAVPPDAAVRSRGQSNRPLPPAVQRASRLARTPGRTAHCRL